VFYSGADDITLTSGDVTLESTGNATATVTVIGTGNFYRVIALSNISGNGKIRFTIEAETASDAAGNLAAASDPSNWVEVINGESAVPTTGEKGVAFLLMLLLAGALRVFALESRNLQPKKTSSSKS